MLGFDPRAARAAWTVVLMALLLVIVYYIRTVLLVFVLAVMFAYLLSPMVNLVNRFLPWPRSRTYSLAAVYTVLIGLLILGGIAISSQVTQEATAMTSGKLQQAVAQRLARPLPDWLEPARQQLRNRIESLSSELVPLVQKASAHFVSVVSSLVYLILVPILGFFFLKDGAKLRDEALSLVAASRRALWEDILNDVHALLGQFIRALLLLSLATFIVYSAFFAIAGVPYGMLLATVAGALEFIPIFGPLAAAVIILLVAVFSGYGHYVVILIFLASYRIFQDYILSPNLMGSGVALHPLLVIFGALAGEELAGIPGMFLSVPILAILRVLHVRIRKARMTAAS
jgi:predicted PurR-regulated permease PerM